MLQQLSKHERDGALAARHALVAEYPAAAIGEPDPAWKDSPPKSIQETKFQAAILANLALWLMHPSTVCFTNAYHAISWIFRGDPDLKPVLQSVEGPTT